MADPLVIVQQFPTNDQTGVYVDSTPWAQFSEAVDPDSVTYYSFTLNERHTYLPVDGSVALSAYRPSAITNSGIVMDAIATFTPTYNLKINTEYTVLASVSIVSKATGAALDHDTVWFFKTGSTLAPDATGVAATPTGVTNPVAAATTGPVSGADPLAILSTSPADFDTNIGRALPHIAITFSDIPYSGINWYDYITISSKGVLG